MRVGVAGTLRAMTGSSEIAPLRLDDRLLGERPQGTARTLGRVTMAALVASCGLSFILSSIFPELGHGTRWVSTSLGLMFLSTMGLSAITVATQLWCWIAPKTRGSLSIDARGFHLTRALGRRDVPLERVEAGWLLRDGEGAEVELRLTNGDVISTSVATPAEADAVLDAAGVDASKRALSMQLGGAALNVAIAAAALVPASCVASMVALGVAKLLVLPSAAMGFLIFTLVAAGVPLALRAFSPPFVQVGLDGVSVRGAFSRWFVPFDQLAQVSLRGRDVVLSLRDGSERVISAAGTGASRCRALAARIAEGVSEAQSPRDLSARLTALDRNGRTLEAWSAALRAVVNDRDAYRHTGLTRDEIAGALDDPRATADRRIGAAYALALADRGDAAARVRVAVETIAHEPVRVALARAAEGELDEESVAAAAADQVRVV
jgi:hypothetical protein